jgi:FkbM family methyltransferase
MRFLFIIATFGLHLHAQAFNHQLINDDQLLLLKYYQLDPSFLKEFPFPAYQVVNSTCQGKFFIDGRDYIKDTLSSPQGWEREIVELIQKYVKPNTVTVDIGAHIGTHTMMMSRCVQKDGVVIAFEPQAKLHRELIMNLQLNNCENVIPVHSALGAQNGVAYLEPERPNNQGYRCITSKQPIEQVTLATLDSFRLTSVSCIKIDVESYELEVLKGAYNTIMNNKPVIIIEIGGGWSREQEENIDSKEYLAAVIDMLENVFNYNVTTISAVTGDYLAIPTH